MITDPAIERYCHDHTTAMPDFLAGVEASTRENLGRRAGMLTGQLEGRFLQALVFLARARSILEVGTFTGYSAMTMAGALQPGGRIVTCEVDPTHAEIAHRNIAASPYADRIEVRLGPAIETIAGLPGPFDFVFIDADKNNYQAYYEAVLPKLSDQGLIAIDNVLWSGRVLDPAADDADTRAIVALNDFICNDRRVVAVMVPIRDGVTLVRRALSG